MGAPAATSKAMAKATVARGRTVFDFDGTKRVAGEEVELPSSEITRLQARGFLVNPKLPAITLADGPTFGTATGPKITRG